MDAGNNFDKDPLFPRRAFSTNYECQHDDTNAIGCVSVSSMAQYLSQLRDMVSRARVTVLRFPKNFQSNRYWILWGQTLYLSTDRHPAELPGVGKKPRRYIRWSKFLRRNTPPPLNSAIFVTELGMFGNMTRRLANGLSVASLAGFGSMVIPRRVIFQGDVFRDGIHHTTNFPTIYFGAEPPTSSNPVDFLLHLNLFDDLGIDKGGATQQINTAWGVLHDILWKSPSLQKTTSKSLTVHIRGGDVFGPRKPRAYGQPPLSFYELVLDDDTWEDVNIVHQDLLNPVLPGLVELCRERGITPHLVSGSLADDVAVLLESTNLVAGRGTFVPAVAGLSRRCTKLYFFEDKCNLVPRRSGIELVRVVDSVGNFTRSLLSQNWVDSPEQHAMMVTYPLSSLVIERS